MALLSPLVRNELDSAVSVVYQVAAHTGDRVGGCLPPRERRATTVLRAMPRSWDSERDEGILVPPTRRPRRMASRRECSNFAR
jgi:hypothetical protein